jgi:hypothetical protein
MTEPNTSPQTTPTDDERGKVALRVVSSGVDFFNASKAGADDEDVVIGRVPTHVKNKTLADKVIKMAEQCGVEVETVKEA